MSAIEPDVTPTPRAADDPIYRVGPAPERLAGALFHGVHEGMITHDQVSTWPGPDGTHAQWARHLIAIDKVCRDSGATASYAAHVKMDAIVMTCPWWCEVKHPQIVSRFDAGQPHTLAVVKCTPDKGDGLGDDFTITIEEYDDYPDIKGRRLQVPVNLEGAELTEAGARELAKALTMAADRMAELDALEASDAMEGV